MSSRIQMRQQLERQKVMEEEKSRSIPKVSNEDLNNSFQNNFQSLNYGNNYLPSLSQSTANPNSNEYMKSYMNNQNNIHFNHDPIHNYSDMDDYILNTSEFSNQMRNIDSPFILQHGYQMDKYMQPFTTDYGIENNVDSINFSCQFRDLSSNNLAQPHDINRNEISLSCPVTGEQTNITSSVVQGPMSLANPEDRRNSVKDRTKKESHNRIERKRRDFINQQIIELSRLIPPQMVTDGESKKNKGNILKNSVDYISHLQNEMNNSSSYIKETELAFILVENYRRRNQELEQQMSNYKTQNTVSSPENQSLAINYNNYLILHEQNQRQFQSNIKLTASRNIKPSTPDSNRRLTPINHNKQQLSPLETCIAFKIEPSSAHSSLGNNSLSTTYRIDEEADLVFNSVQDTLSPRTNYQNTNNNHPSLPSMHSESFFSSNTHYGCIDSHKCESMEC